MFLAGFAVAATGHPVAGTAAPPGDEDELAERSLAYVLAAVVRFVAQLRLADPQGAADRTSTGAAGGAPPA